MVFCVLVDQVLGFSVPVVAKLVLRGAATEPPELARINSIVDNSSSCGVICLDRAFRLGPPHVDEGLEVGYHFLCCDEKCSKFGFSSRCHNKVDELGNRENSPVELREGVIL